MRQPAGCSAGCHPASQPGRAAPAPAQLLQPGAHAVWCERAGSSVRANPMRRCGASCSLTHCVLYCTLMYLCVLLPAVLWPKTSWTTCWCTTSWVSGCPSCSWQTKWTCPQRWHRWSWHRCANSSGSSSSCSRKTASSRTPHCALRCCLRASLGPCTGRCGSGLTLMPAVTKELVLCRCVVHLAWCCCRMCIGAAPGGDAGAGLADCSHKRPNRRRPGQGDGVAGGQTAAQLTAAATAAARVPGEVGSDCRGVGQLAAAEEEWPCQCACCACGCSSSSSGVGVAAVEWDERGGQVGRVLSMCLHNPTTCACGCL